MVNLEKTFVVLKTRIIQYSTSFQNDYDSFIELYYKLLKTGRQIIRSFFAIFILNNEGYHSIRQKQHNYFNGREIGCGKSSGLTFPSFKKIANAFNFKYFLELKLILLMG